MTGFSNLRAQTKIAGCQLFFFILILTVLSCQSETPPSHPIEAIEKGLIPSILITGQPEPTYTITERMAHYNVPGISIAFFEDGEIQWTKCYGHIDSAQSQLINEQTVFQAASISKPVAATGALILAEQGHLDLDEDINTYLSGWKIPANAYTDSEKVTGRRLVTHNAGLTVHGFPGYGQSDSIPTVEQVLDGVPPANTDAVRADTFPGAIWRYSGGGYTVLQKAMMDITGENFPKLMRRLVIDKLGMSRSTYAQPLPVGWVNAAIAHRSAGNPIGGSFHTYPEMAAAGLWTTPTDLAKYAIAIQQAFSGANESLLSQTMARDMLTDQIDEMGLGVFLGIRGDTLAFSHGGSNEGFRCQLYAFVKPMTQGIAIMTNGDNGGNLQGEILRGIARAYGWDIYRPRYKTVVDLGAKVLEKYAGIYDFGDGFKVTLRLLDDKLEAEQSWNQMKYFILPESDTLFFDANDGGPFEFRFDTDNKVTGVLASGQYEGRKEE